jgi:tRNA dimethylallyltransferase
LNRLIVIAGPTAAGKSALALRLAQQLDGEIISGDSMCVYRGLDIGTAKPSVSEQKLVPHHLIDIRRPTEPFSVVDFQQLAAAAIDEVNRRGKLPILVGGTGLYIQALLEGYQFNPTPITTLRDDAESTDTLYERLNECDPLTAGRIHPNDRKRILRALEVITTENQPLSTDKAAQLQYDCLAFGLTMDRQTLYHRIDQRVDRMVEQGLLAEIDAILTQGLTANATALQAIGYKEFIAAIQNNLPLEMAVEQVKMASRRYAKRQLTWFRRMSYLEWIELDATSTMDMALDLILRRVAERYAIK